MKLELIKSSAALNKAYKNSNLNEDQIERFKENLLTLFNRIDEKESEEFLKNILSDFLKKTYYENKHEINTKGRQDLAIYTDKTSASNVGVIIEVKHPNNKSGMISKANPNADALHELMHYYLQERFIRGNKEIKHLIVTNIYEWYIFDGTDFERFFFENKKLTKEYKDWNDGLFGVNKTEWFYKEMAKPFIENELEMLPCTYFNLKEIEKVIRRRDKAKDNTLIDFYKILSSEHLLKKPFANDTNILNKDFYNELLHLLGLEETKETGKKLIKRKKEESRNEGSLLENTINILKTRNKLAAFENPKQFGENEEEQLFSLGLELCITWLNRILFLKLLEGQLKKYHLGDRAYEFLNYNKIKDFDELNELFFEVLAVPVKQRTRSVIDKFGSLPYLNSSLFEESEIERKSLVISDLKDRLKIPVLSSTVLKEANGKKILGSKNTLEYLFEFLDAYNFESDNKAVIQTVSKTIINASVLGLIFEKINGYKDGSFFTPSFITMYMSRETIRKAVIQKFNEQYNWQCSSFNDLFNKLDKISLEQANATIDNLKICDPAVGSGHFLVSALNEIITIKNDLQILTDAEGKRLRGYNISTENDELIITCEAEHFIYNYKDKESRRIQETLFHEKQKIIENSLFGVDINPKSVMICRLRLWIELLKNMYYTQSSSYTELETLPNIDINIKCGNSLVHSFDIKGSFAKIPAYMQHTIKVATQKYKDQVLIYKSTSDKATKKSAEKNINELKLTFAGITNPTDLDYIKWKEAKDKLGVLPDLFSRDAQDEWKLKFERLSKEEEMLRKKYEHKLETLYGNAFEWRFEFPEVLNEDGQFVGFDVVIGNPPYIRQEKIETTYKEFYLEHFRNVGTSTADIYVYFFGLALQISKPKGFICLITLNKWLKTKYGNNLRLTLADLDVLNIIDFFELRVFEEASTDSAITLIQNENKNTTSKYFPVKTLEDLNLFTLTEKEKFLGVSKEESEWKFINKGYNSILDKLEDDTISLKDFTKEKMYRGVVTGANEVFVINDVLKEELCRKDKESIEIIRPYARPTEFTPYKITGEKEWFINAHNGILVTKKDLNKYSEEKDGKVFMPINGQMVEVFRKEERGKSNLRLNRIDVENDYPGIYAYFSKYKDKLIKRGDKGDHWTNLRNCDYVYEFDEPKIIYVYTAKRHHFYFDTEGKMINNSSYMIVTGSKYLWAYLNSKLFLWLTKIKFVAYGDAEESGRVKLDFNKMETVPVKRLTPEQEIEFENKVNQLFEIKHVNPKVDVAELETELNKMVYELYGITPDEQRIIEGERLA